MPYGKNEIYMRSSSGKVWTEWECVGGNQVKCYKLSDNVRVTNNASYSAGYDRLVALMHWYSKYSGVVKVIARKSGESGTGYLMVSNGRLRGTHNASSYSNNLLPINLAIGSTLNNVDFYSYSDVNYFSGASSGDLSVVVRVEAGTPLVICGFAYGTFSNICICYDEIEL